MENKILSLSHNDLDGISCQLAIFEKYKKNINFFNTSYNDIEKKLKILEDVITINFKKIFITDLYFKKNNFQQLEKIIKLNPNIKFIYIDHHEYEESEKEIIKKLKKYSNFIFIHSLKVSASKLTFLALKLKNLDLKKLIELVDIYDLWKENNPKFKLAFFLNIIFWEITGKGFFTQIKINKYKIPLNFKEIYKKVIKEKNIYFKELYKNNLIQVKNNILVSFIDHYKNFLIIENPNIKVFIIASISYYGISIRISRAIPENQAKDLKDQILKFCKNNSNIISAGGHLYAFGISLTNSIPFEIYLDIINQIKDIVLKFYNLNFYN